MVMYMQISSIFILGAGGKPAILIKLGGSWLVLGLV